jgi:hypothetical protein
MARIREPEAKYIADNKGKKKAVILPIEKYEELLEDLDDLAVIASRKKEPIHGWNDLKKKLKKDGPFSDSIKGFR